MAPRTCRSRRGLASFLRTAVLVAAGHEASPKLRGTTGSTRKKYQFTLRKSKLADFTHRPEATSNTQEQLPEPPCLIFAVSGGVRLVEAKSQSELALVVADCSRGTGMERTPRISRRSLRWCEVFAQQFMHMLAGHLRESVTMDIIQRRRL